ncbi:hypothetical protein VOLCADRAFT_88990 [Volvox carteri f. nagariensis]|uniref:Uncharacterized protein n=1 Tax=Volvox carteri f. nagariensis TaxID=3068 RepID=D8TQH8_VOLCA|nr:uncharacterized protein VOLCADRAFT_88990 [Volvox carteri f. nagariensis]EFJ50157.1 hypothetical protein VOLCADRAFT_88990 [Volvox carteri f. nagariensis]|eukprot:XP_002948777.1 hypothetical protein VOLCADRAFT_88990 [Volvox carteri f. nagariensis]
MWIYQAVTNVGVQVLVLIALGYLFARFKLLEQAKFLPQSNFVVLMLALPAFNLYLMGIKLDLQNPEPWKSLAAFLLWVFLVQACILAYTWRFCGGDAGEAAVINMVLLMDNYAITGLLALNATLGTKWGTLALLMAMGFFLVIFPFSLAAFEWEKWAVQQHVEAIAEAAAVDIEAAAAAAAEAEGVDGVKQPPEASGFNNQPLLLAGTPPPQGLPRCTENGVDLEGHVPKADGEVELSVCLDADHVQPQRQPPSDGSKPSANGGADAGVLVPTSRGVDQGGESQQDESSFPHESRYCWWSNVDYRPVRPLLGSEVAPSSQPLQRTAAKQQWQPHRRQGLLPEQLRRQQQQLRTGAYVPPVLLPAPPAGITSPAGSSHPLVSPFEARATAAFSNDVAIGTALERGPQLQPATALASAGRRPVTVSSVPSQSQTPRSGLVEHRRSSLLASVFERLAAAGSGQLPFGDLGRTGIVTLPPEPERPRLQDLEFALTHQLSGGTASQLARISRGYAAAAAAATAAAASPDANLRRMLLGAAGAGGRSPRQMASAASRQGSEPVGLTHLAAAAGPAVGIATPGRAPGSMPRTGIMQPPPSASTGKGGIGGLGPLVLSQQPQGGGAGDAGTTGTSAAPTTLASLESGDSIGPPLRPPMPESTDSDAATAAIKYSELACPTLSQQIASSAAAPWHAASAQLRPPAAEGHLSSMSTPMFSFERQSQQRRPAAATGPANTAAGASDFPRQWGTVNRSASDTGQVDKMLLKLASGLALDTAMRRTVSGHGDRSPLLAEIDPNVLVQLASAVAVPDSGDLSALAAADKELVREATREALRRHGGVARAFAAFVSGHPQLWHIVSTLARNPMIWTMFVAMTVSVSGLRVFLDPASPRYRPEVGWIAGSLSWINGLVVPISIFSNGAWMYSKPLLPKGEVVKVLVLLLIKVGALPLLMAGCALLVKLDEQHVAAMTVLTLSPAAAASFVLAVQYGRGVELVSLTNILGNIFLTPLLIMWLKVRLPGRVVDRVATARGFLSGCKDTRKGPDAMCSGDHLVFVAMG